MYIDAEENLKILESSLDGLEQKMSSFTLSFETEFTRELTASRDKIGGEPTLKLNVEQRLDVDYSMQLQLCEELKKVKNLVDRLMFLNTLDKEDGEEKENIDFPEIINNYVKLKVSINELIENLQLKGKYIRIIDDIEKQLNTYQQTIEKLIQRNLENYLHFQSNSSVTYTDKVGNMKFSEYLQGCHRYTLSDDPDETRLFNFRKIFNGWTEEVLNKIENGFFAGVVENENMRKININVKEGSKIGTFSDYIKSVENVIRFFNRLVEYNSTTRSYDPFKHLRFVVGKTILRSLKMEIFSDKNIYPLMSSYLKAQTDERGGNGTPKELKSISDLLSQPGWSRDGMCEIEFWMDDLISTWINDLSSKAMNEQKNIVFNMINGKYKEYFEAKNIIQETINEDRTVENASERNSNEINNEIKDDKNDDWNNAWDEQDDDKQRTEKATVVNENNEEEEEEEDGWDDWGDEEEDNWINDTKKASNAATAIGKVSDSQKPLQEQLVKSESRVLLYKRTIIADKVLEVIANYYKQYADLENATKDKGQLEDAYSQFRNGLKKLITCYYMLVSANMQHCYPRPILFYNDLNFIIQGVSVQYKIDLSTCFDMSYRIVDELNIENTQKVSDIVDRYASDLFEGEAADDEERRLKMDEFETNLKQTLGEIQSKLDITKSDNSKLVNSIYLNIINTLFDKISNKLLSRDEIGSDECDSLGEMINDVINMASVLLSDGFIDVRKVQSYHKLKQVKLIIVSNLKTILQDFYDAKFFELETGELIKIVKALFVDSSKRRDVIDKIHAVRDVTDVDG